MTPREMVDPVWMLSVFLAVLLGGVLLLWVRHCSSGWHRASKSGARLPKGSFGWPIIGESIEYSRNPATWASSRFHRYGKIFKSSLFLQPSILGTTPEFVKFVMSNSNLFVSGWPTLVMDILGHKAFAFKDGAPHTSIKRLVQKPFFPDSLRTKINTLETIILQNLGLWEQSGTVLTIKALEKVTTDLGVCMLLGIRDMESTAEGRKGLENLRNLEKAFLSLPINLPGTAYNSGLKGRAALTDYIKFLIEERQGKENLESDVLGVLLAAREDDQAREEVKGLDDEMIADNVVLMWFASYDTTKISLIWILKFMIDYPEVFRRLQAEQLEILKGKYPSVEGPRLTWEDTRKMVFAQKFFQEVQRTLSIAPVVMRRATQDVEFDGHLIPKGWGVLPSFSFIHQDPAVYPDPNSFNPDRFDTTPKPYTYLAFSAGTHICPGMEFVKEVCLIFIHHLTTTYIYESAGPDKGMEYKFSFPVPVGGFPINIRQRHEVW